MTPQARVQAAIELLDEVIAAAAAGGASADTIVARYFQARRYAGSKDRRAVRDLVYAAIRRCGERPASGRTAMLSLADGQPGLIDLFDGSPHAPPPVGPGETAASAGIAPAWILDRLQRTVPTADQSALLDRAPLDLRVNRLKAGREEVLALFPGAEPLPYAEDGVRLAESTQVERHEGWLAGLFEVQDEGSQIAVNAAEAAPGMTVVDLCAGAGGKTLALAAAMRNEGRLVAADTDRRRLSRLAPRAQRAGVTMVETVLLDPGREAEALSGLEAGADLVLVDAPCSGTGTWRRNPETRWRLTPDRLARLMSLQAHLLDTGSRLVRPGGRLLYVVCSLLAEEGCEQVDAFLSRHPGWSVDMPELPTGRPSGKGMLLTPAQDGTDGFFIARLKRPC